MFRPSQPSVDVKFNTVQFRNIYVFSRSSSQPKYDEFIFVLRSFKEDIQFAYRIVFTTEETNHMPAMKL